MFETARFETDEFLKLLTDALRAGPGSPQWHEAVSRLRQINPTEADEYRLIITAREHLESGRDYRSIRPGPQFTRKVMERIRQEASRAGMPAGNLLAILGAIGVVAVIVVVAFMLLRGMEQHGTVADLLTTEFRKTLVSADFARGIGGEWRTFGLQPVISSRSKSLRGAHHAEDERDYHGGGVHLAEALPSDKAILLEVSLRMVRPTSQVDVQLFFTQDLSFSGPKATSLHELVVDVCNGQVSVFRPDTSLAGEALKLPEGREEVAVSVRMDGRFVIVRCGGKELYAGPHGLNPARPRWLGVRFLTKGQERGLEDVTVQSIRLMTP